MDKEEFIDMLQEDCADPMVVRYKDNYKVLEGIYDLCRQTYLTQYDAENIKVGNSIRYRITEESFARLRKLIDGFISSLDNNSNDDLLEETIGIIEKYYIETRTTKESVSRGYIDNSNELADVYYSFDAIDWDYFRKGLKINNN